MSDEYYGTIKYKGYWEIGGRYGIAINLVQRPFWLHRLMMPLLLGIHWFNGEWKDNEHIQ